MEDLDMLQKIGLAFIAGLTAGQTIKVKEEPERRGRGKSRSWKTRRKKSKRVYEIYRKNYRGGKINE